MKNMRFWRTALVTTLVLTVMLSVTGGTIAWFTNSVESANNVITAGNLDVEVQYTLDGKNWAALDGAEDLFQKGLWEPGHTEVVVLKIENKGSLAAKFTAKMNIVEETVGKTKEGKNIVLSDILTAKTLVIEDAGVEPLLGYNIALKAIEEAFKSDDVEFAWGEASSVEAHNILGTKDMLRSKATMYVFVKVDMAETVGNEANHNGTDIPSIAFGIEVEATQATVEYDSFDNQYDKDAPIYNVSTVQELKDAMLVRGGNIVLTDNLVIDEDTPLQWNAYMFVANGREVTIDLNGKSIIVEKGASLKTKGLFTTANGGTLNIVGEGTMEVKNGQSGIFHAMNKDDQINVYGGTYISNSDNGSEALAIIYTNSGNVDVYGGKFIPQDGVTCANAEDRQGNRLSIVFHEGTLLKHNMYYAGDDAARIRLAEGCMLKAVDIDSETWYQVAAE